ncbi:family 16 glycoside hydrolase [Isosphaeraceae bacterium EP7]
MGTLLKRTWFLSVAMIGLALVAEGRAAEPSPPEGFRAIFNGRDLAGWHGLNPHSVGDLTGEKKEANLTQQRADFPKNWSVADGELINDGHGPYATTDEEFGDLELLIDYKTVPNADSGIYLRGTPQVQIWDWNQVFDPKVPTRKPHLGSGGLFNNTPGATGRDPLVLADRPFGEWNRFRIRQINDRTWVWLNDKLVVDGAVMENYADRTRPLPARGPIMLQTHGGEIRWRNIFVREIGAEEAKETLRAAEAETKASLSRALTLHASFDNGLDADFARGDKTCYVQQGKNLLAAAPTAEVRLSPEAGRFGGGLIFTKKNEFRPAFKDSGVLGYNDKGWNATVSVWLRLNPDLDLEPGYCDPVQIVGDDSKKGYIFLEWSKDETPRYFRYAIRPLFQIWNPTNVQWADIPFEKRPMVQVAKASFSRDTWTHVVFTLENVNDKSKPQVGRLYLNGKAQGAIENWDLTFAWDPAQVLLVLGASYVGQMDDLAVFNRALNADDVRMLHGLKGGVRDLRR